MIIVAFAGLWGIPKLLRNVQVPDFLKNLLVFSMLFLTFMRFVLGLGFSNLLVVIPMVLSCICWLIIFWLNPSQIGMVLLLGGVFMNSAVIFANNGRMPVSREQALKMGTTDIGHTGKDQQYIFINEKTKLPFLADKFYFPPDTIVSTGDYFILASLLVMGIQNRKTKVPSQ